VRIRLPHPLRAREARRIAAYQAYTELALSVTRTTVDYLVSKPIQHSYTIRHEPRPPAPRPSRMTVIWELQQGAEWREYVSLNGQRSTVMMAPGFMRGGNDHLLPPVSVRYEFGYTDGSAWQ
jgi:hypothetical protein